MLTCWKRREVWMARAEFLHCRIAVDDEGGCKHWRAGQARRREFCEATLSGGLLKYWYGKPDAERRNLATCMYSESRCRPFFVTVRLILSVGIWANREAALGGLDGPWHRMAIEAAPRLYGDFHVSLHSMVVTDRAALWRMEKYKINQTVLGACGAYPWLRNVLHTISGLFAWWKSWDNWKSSFA